MRQLYILYSMGPLTAWFTLVYTHICVLYACVVLFVSLSVSLRTYIICLHAFVERGIHCIKLWLNLFPWGYRLKCITSLKRILMAAYGRIERGMHCMGPFCFVSVVRGFILSTHAFRLKRILVESTSWTTTCVELCRVVTTRRYFNPHLSSLPFFRRQKFTYIRLSSGEDSRTSCRVC